MKIQISPEKTVEAEVIAFIPMAEPWSEYHLDNGAIIRFRSTAARILKLPEKNDDGTDQYFVQSNAQVVVNEREDVRP